MTGQGHVQIRMLHKLPLLKELNEPQLHDLAEHSKLCQYAPREIIFKEGDADDGCYIIICGMVNITTTASNGTTIPVATLGQGEFFGAIATLTGHPRIANVACATPVTLLRTTKELLLKLINLSPYIKKNVDQRYRERALRIHLKKINIFSKLKPELIEELASKVQFKSYAKDDIIFKQGDP
ncbi:MAG TPA: cyclic nucleotide-binding domain-containing protein, partial [Candidatus Brocadiales bacterium]|nr:cyclic nucleotide-binding domain-containing protein [Candidatus Brocadiales bacterium]